MLKFILVAAGGIATYMYFKGRRMTGQSTNETVRQLQMGLNLVQDKIYQSAVAVASRESMVGRPPVFFHELLEDGVFGVETKGAMGNLKFFARLVSNQQSETWSLEPLRNIDADQLSAGDLLAALAPLVEWANTIGEPSSTALTLELGRIYLAVVTP